jgi:hypothetical protein
MNADKGIPCNLRLSALLSFKSFAGRDDFHIGLASLSLWGRLIEAAEKVRKQRLEPPMNADKPIPFNLRLSAFICG